jgi:hypothetical protein
VNDLLPPASTIDVPLKDQIDEVAREIIMRQRVYGHQVAIKKMTQAEADRRILRMQAVLATLQRLK